jgi:hypothetical protein
MDVFEGLEPIIDVDFIPADEWNEPLDGGAMTSPHSSIWRFLDGETTQPREEGVTVSSRATLMAASFSVKYPPRGYPVGWEITSQAYHNKYNDCLEAIEKHTVYALNATVREGWPVCKFIDSLMGQRRDFIRLFEDIAIRGRITDGQLSSLCNVLEKMFYYYVRELLLARGASRTYFIGNSQSQFAEDFGIYMPNIDIQRPSKFGGAHCQHFNILSDMASRTTQ